MKVRRFNLGPVLAIAGCASTTVTTTVLPPHRLQDPICPTAVIIHEAPGEVPPGGRVLAQIRVEGGGLGLTNEKIRKRLQEEAAKLGANRVLAAEVTTPSTLAALGMTLATSINTQDRDVQRLEAATEPNHAGEATAPVPTDPSFYGRGLAYAIFVPDDTLRTNLECPRTSPAGYGNHP
jgi:hypothetical protein